MIKTLKPTMDAIEIMNRRFGNGPEERAEIERFKLEMEFGSDLYAAREAAGLTRRQLAGRVGVKPSLIEDVELADYEDYEGDALDLLRRIAAALGRTIEVRLSDPIRSDEPAGAEAKPEALEPAAAAG